MKNSLHFSAILSTRAQKEVSVSWEWYEERSLGLGDRFLEAVKAKIREIEKEPFNYSARYKEYRETSLDSFPYQIVFRINQRKKSIRIVSLFHSARNPNGKYKS
jgi:plasmid stabilization system protein ParE